MDIQSFDTIIVGAGTAGCLLANRLSKNSSRSVLLIEAGDTPRNLWIPIPAGVSRLIFPGKYNWGFHTAPEPELKNRKIYAPRGRGLGGTSLINGMAFFRGQPEDYDSWKDLGLEGWSWTDTEPLYRRLENWRGDKSSMRGLDGEIHITESPYLHPVSRKFIDAGISMGLPENKDFNAYGTSGIGIIQFNIKDGIRHSSDRAFLNAAVKKRKNLTILTNARVRRICLEDKRAVGVELICNGITQTIRCRKEIILSAGTFGSPHILMNSGIGDGTELAKHGIAVRHHLSGVGRNLQDHFYVNHAYSCTAGSSMNGQLRGWRLLLNGARYLLTRRGPLAMGASQACAFLASGVGEARPDVQVSFRPVSWIFNPDGTLTIGKKPELTVTVCNLRPKSRGQISLASADPLAPPRIQANYLSDEYDRRVMVQAVRKVRNLFKQGPLASVITGEIAPGERYQSDEEITDYLRENGQSMHHWAGSCAMGKDTSAVVNDRLQVIGIDGLCVADCSVIPRIVSGNTNAVSFLVAEKAATFFG